MYVFKAFESPTLPVAMPQPFDGELDQEMAYLSGIVPSDGEFQFNTTFSPLILTERFVGEFIGGYMYAPIADKDCWAWANSDCFCCKIVSKDGSLIIVTDVDEPNQDDGTNPQLLEFS